MFLYILVTLLALIVVVIDRTIGFHSKKRRFMRLLKAAETGDEHSLMKLLDSRAEIWGGRYYRPWESWLKRKNDLELIKRVAILGDGLSQLWVSSKQQQKEEPIARAERRLREELEDRQRVLYSADTTIKRVTALFRLQAFWRRNYANNHREEFYRTALERLKQTEKPDLGRLASDLKQSLDDYCNPLIAQASSNTEQGRQSFNNLRAFLLKFGRGEYDTATGQRFIPEFDWPKNWRELVCRFVDNPTKDDLRLFDDPDPGRLRLEAAAALRQLDLYAAKRVLAYVNSKDSYRLEVGEMAEALAKYVEAENAKLHAEREAQSGVR